MKDKVNGLDEKCLKVYKISTKQNIVICFQLFSVL